MSGLTHITGALLLGSAAIYCTNATGNPPDIATAGSYLAGCMFGAVLCDLDEPNSLIGRKLWPISFLFRFSHWFFRIISWFLPKNSRIRKNISGISRAAAHRGMMHWPLTTLLLSTLFLFITYSINQYVSISGLDTVLYGIAIGISTGLLSHLIYDFPSGTLPLFAPFSNKRYGLKLIESNGFADTHIVRTLNILGSAYLLFL